ncbi:MAG TPA: hypothetical protein PKH09_00530 [Parvularculaceae bacterium]|nr:hypothetical protein [Parvularculaceae bacterium]
MAERLAFIDFEASGLGARSWPIEVGWAFEDGAGESFLVSPAPEWSLDDWDPRAEKLHGVSLKMLSDLGVSAETACDRVSAALAGCGAVGLDATAAGRAVYARMGFTELCAVSRMVARRLPRLAVPEGVRAMTEDDLADLPQDADGGYLCPQCGRPLLLEITRINFVPGHVTPDGEVDYDVLGEGDEYLTDVWCRHCQWTYMSAPAEPEAPTAP